MRHILLKRINVSMIKSSQIQSVLNVRVATFVSKQKVFSESIIQDQLRACLSLHTIYIHVKKSTSPKIVENV